MEYTAAAGRKNLSAYIKASVPKYVLLAPSIILLAVFHYWPIYGIVIAFKKFNPISGIMKSDWAGFYYFNLFLRDPGFWTVMRNTVMINIYGLVFGFPFPILFALLLNELRGKKFVKVTQTVSYLPNFITWMVACGIFVTILSPSNGIINKIITSFGGQPVYFLTKREYFWPIITIQGIWKGFGMGSVYYIAALTGIDQELYMAAAIDGAGRLKQTWHITLPGLRNIIIVLFVLNLGGMISIGFDQIFFMYNPAVYEVGDVISTYVYRFGLEKAEYSYTTAVGLMQNVVGFAMVYGANRMARKVAGWSLW